MKTCAVGTQRRSSGSASRSGGGGRVRSNPRSTSPRRRRSSSGIGGKAVGHGAAFDADRPHVRAPFVAGAGREDSESPGESASTTAGRSLRRRCDIGAGIPIRQRADRRRRTSRSCALGDRRRLGAADGRRRYDRIRTVASRPQPSEVAGRCRRHRHHEELRQLVRMQLAQPRLHAATRSRVVLMTSWRSTSLLDARPATDRPTSSARQTFTHAASRSSTSARAIASPASPAGTVVRTSTTSVIGSASHDRPAHVDSGCALYDVTNVGTCCCARVRVDRSAAGAAQADRQAPQRAGRTRRLVRLSASVVAVP